MTPVTRRILLATAAFLLLILLAALALWWHSRPQDAVSLTSLSPDGRFRVSLLEHLGRLDRNFALRLEDTTTGAAQIVFESPDEGRPIGTERLIWSPDSAAVLLVGQHFYVSPQVRFDDCEAYLILTTADHSIKCNARQARHPRIVEADLGPFSGER